MRIRTQLLALTILLASFAGPAGIVAHGQSVVAPEAPQRTTAERTTAERTVEQRLAEPAGRSLGIASISNLRDVGGFVTRDGLVVRTGRLYRSNQLGRISADDMKKIELLGLKNDYDLRRDDERNSAPDMLPAGVNNICLNVMADSPLTALQSVGRMLQNPQETNTTYGDGKMEERFHTVYRQFITLPSAQKAYHQLFSDLGKEENLPALFHCTAGKDRTGWAAAALLTLLGVPREVVFEDYMRSNDYTLPGYQRMIDSFVQSGGQPSILPAMLGVKREFLQTAFDELAAKYGTIEGYFANGLGIDAAGQQALRDRFLTRPAH